MNIIDRTSYAVKHAEVYLPKEFHTAWDNPKLVRLMGNELTFSPSQEIRQAILSVTDKLNYYPEDIATNEKIREKIAEYVGKPMTSANITIGNGSIELIDLVYKTFLCPGDEVLVPTPEYSLYFKYPPLYGAKVIDVLPDKDDFNYSTESFLKLITDKTKLIVASNPNNPVGTLLSRDTVQRLCETEKLILIDEAYIEFSNTSLYDLISTYPNLIILRTLSKAIGLAGIRFGYCLANPEIIEYMNRVRLIMNSSVIAQAVAMVALNHRDYIQETIKKIIENRNYLNSELQNIPEFKVYPSHANYVLIGCAKTGITATEFFEKLLQRGYLIRRFAKSRGFPGDEHFRISIGTSDEMKGVIREIHSILQEKAVASISTV